MMKMFTSKKFIIGAVAVIVILVVVFAFRGKNKSAADTFIVKKDNIVQEVSVTGTVKPAEEIKLAFEAGGRVKALGPKVGEHVSAGQLLVELDYSDLSAQYASAQASVENAQAQLAQYQAAYDSQAAKLAALRRGSRPEDIAVKLEELNKARQDLENYYGDVIDTLSDAYTKSDDGVRTKLASLFSGSAINSYNLTFTTSDYQAGIDSANLRYDIEQKLVAWRRQIDSLSSASSKGDLDSALAAGKANLLSIKTFFERVSDTLQTSTNLTSTVRDAYLASLYTARTNVVTALGTVSALEQNIAAQKVYVSKIQKEYDLKISGSDPQDIASQEALVRQAEANVKSAQASIRQYQANAGSVSAKISKMTLRSPISGQVTKQDAEIGEIVTAGSEVSGVISDTNFEIKADVPEVDIAKLQIGNGSKVTLDAYGDAVPFAAKLADIEPAETVIQGVTYYKVTLVFDKIDERLKSGMTANVIIRTAQKDGVLSVPQRGIFEESGKKYVRLVPKGKTAPDFEKREVTAGLAGVSGMMEITSGLSEGDVIITLLNGKK